MMNKPKLKQYGIKPILYGPDDELDLEVTELEFGPWVLVTEASPIYEEMWKEIETLRDKLHEIKHWCAAYPLDIFPEPDFKKARELLEAGGMTIDAISASNMRHVVTGIQRIIEEE